MDALQFLRVIFIDESAGDVRVFVKDSDKHMNMWKPNIMEDVGMYMDKHGYTKLSIVDMKVARIAGSNKNTVYLTCTAE